MIASPFSHVDRPWRGLRIGLVVPRFKHSAVERNQVKRRLRELSRLQLLPTDLPADMVLRIRPEAYGASFSVLATDIVRILTQLQRWYATSKTVKADAESIIQRASEQL